MSVLVDTLAQTETSSLKYDQGQTMKTDFDRHDFPSAPQIDNPFIWLLILFALAGICSVIFYSAGFLGFSTKQSFVNKPAMVAETSEGTELIPLAEFVKKESVKVRPIVPPTATKTESAKVNEQHAATDSAPVNAASSLTDIASRMDTIETAIQNIAKNLVVTPKEMLSTQPASTISAEPEENSVPYLAVEIDKPGIKISRRLKTEAIRLEIEKANNLFLQGKTDLAANIYREVVRQDIFRREALMGLASIAVHNRRFDTARRIYNQILLLDPKDKEALSRLISLRENDDPTRRASQLKTMIRSEPDNYRLHFILGTIYMANKQWSEARLTFQQAHLLEKDHPDTVYNLAISLDHLRKPGEALKYYLLATNLAEKYSAEFELSQADNRIKELQDFFGKQKQFNNQLVQAKD
jgi:tetratricopeptide (TPR) repeat protein